MKRLTIIALLAATSAHAGGYTPPRIDPPVIAPECPFLSFRCHTGFDYINPEGDNPLPQSRPEPEPEDEEQEACE